MPSCNKAHIAQVTCSYSSKLLLLPVPPLCLTALTPHHVTTPAPLAGTSSPNMLAARLSGLEGALNELAAYQVTNSALLHHLGGRLSPGPGSEGPGGPAAAAGQAGGLAGQQTGSPAGAAAAAGGAGAHGPRASEPPMRAGEAKEVVVALSLGGGRGRSQPQARPDGPMQQPCWGCQTTMQSPRQYRCHSTPICHQRLPNPVCLQVCLQGPAALCFDDIHVELRHAMLGIHIILISADNP